MKFDRDTLANADRAQVAQAAFAVIDRVQQLPPALRVAGIAVAFKEVAEYLEVEPQDAFTIVGNLMRDPQDGMSKAPQFAAIRDYMRGEMQ